MHLPNQKGNKHKHKQRHGHGNILHPTPRGTVWPDVGNLLGRILYHLLGHFSWQIGQCMPVSSAHFSNCLWLTDWGPGNYRSKKWNYRLPANHSQQSLLVQLRSGCGLHAWIIQSCTPQVPKPDLKKTTARLIIQIGFIVLLKTTESTLSSNRIQSFQPCNSLAWPSIQKLRRRKWK